MSINFSRQTGGSTLILLQDCHSVCTSLMWNAPGPMTAIQNSWVSGFKSSTGTLWQTQIGSRVLQTHSQSFTSLQTEFCKPSLSSKWLTPALLSSNTVLTDGFPKCTPSWRLWLPTVMMVCMIPCTLLRLLGTLSWSGNPFKWVQNTFTSLVTTALKCLHDSSSLETKSFLPKTLLSLSHG